MYFPLLIFYKYQCMYCRVVIRNCSRNSKHYYFIFCCTQLTLISYTLTPTGSEYQRLTIWPLSLFKISETPGWKPSNRYALTGNESLTVNPYMKTLKHREITMALQKPTASQNMKFWITMYPPHLPHYQLHRDHAYPDLLFQQQQSQNPTPSKDHNPTPSTYQNQN